MVFAFALLALPRAMAPVPQSRFDRWLKEEGKKPTP
jgi:hypothetical protein